MKVLSMNFELREDDSGRYAFVRARLKDDGSWDVEIQPSSMFENLNLSTADFDAALEQITQMRQFVERVQGILEP